MQFVEPKVFHVAHTVLMPKGVQDYMDALDIPDWVTDAPSDVEKLIEIMGRGCYRSFQPGMNKNVTKIREGNTPYTKNILATRHGSVVEHAADSYIFLDVSRVFTHELVRNRIGNAFSQESLRYVRLDSLKTWFPKVFRDHPKSEILREFMLRKYSLMETWQTELAKMLEIDPAARTEVGARVRSFAPNDPAPRVEVDEATFTLSPSAHPARWDFWCERRVELSEGARLRRYVDFVHALPLLPRLRRSRSRRRVGRRVELVVGGLTSTRVEEALCRTVAEAARCYGVDTGFEWVGLLCRYGAARATLRLAQRNASSLEPFGSVTDLTTGRERPVTMSVEREQWSIACDVCPPRSLLRIYWPLGRT